MNIDLNRFKGAAPDQPADPQAKAWADWLGDEPIQSRQPQTPIARPRPSVSTEMIFSSAPTPRPQQATASTQPQPPVTAAPSTNVSINISLPKFKKPQLPKLPYKKIAIYAAAALAIFALGIAIKTGVQAYQKSHKVQEAASALQAASGGQPDRQAPSFAPLTPAGQSPKTNSYDAAKDSYNYVDQIKGTQLLVSQQTLPAKFSASPAQLADFAKSLKASATLPVNKGTAYLATDAKSGQQMVIMASDNVLLFAQSAFQHSTADWANYLNTLAVLH